MADSWDSDSDEVYRTYLSHFVYWFILSILAYSGYFWLMTFFLFFGVTLVVPAEDTEEEDIFVDEDETEAYHHAMMEFEMFREYFDDETDVTLGEWSGIEIMPMDMDELLDSVTEDPLVNVSPILNHFFMNNYSLLYPVYRVRNLDISNVVALYWRDDYMPHTLHDHTTKRLQYIDYHDMYKKSKDWTQVRRQWKEIYTEEVQKRYHNSMLMASVLDQGLHGLREYDFCSFHYYDYIETFELLNNISEISYAEDQFDLKEYMKLLQGKKESVIPESKNDSKYHLVTSNADTISSENNGSIPSLANKDFDENFFDNHLVWGDPLIITSYSYMRNTFSSNINISYLNIAYSPVLSIIHGSQDLEKRRILTDYYDGMS